jgi:hypothetical protein
VATGAASALTGTTATVSGTVNPNGSPIEECFFEYGPTESYGSEAPCMPQPGGGSVPVSVTAGLTGLQGGTTYHYRIFAEGEGGPSHGGDGTLTTPIAPSVTLQSAVTGPSTQGSTTGASFQGTVNPNRTAVTECQFEYGTGAAPEGVLPCPVSVGAGSVPVFVAGTVTSLRWDTLYWARLKAGSAGGVAEQTVSFLTGNQLVTYVPPTYFYSYPGPTQSYPSYYVPTYVPAKPSVAVAKCLKLQGRKRSECLTAAYGGNPNDVGLYVAFCPKHAAAASTRAQAASTSEKGWPPKQCLKMDKGPAGQRHTIVGEHGVHNWLLGGYGNDTIIGGNLGDVIWADYHPEGEPKHQTATIRAGNGRNVIYADDTVNYVWTGTNPGTIVHAHVSGVSGVIHCGSSRQVIFLSHVSEKHFQLHGCGRISHYSVGY